MKKIIHDQRMYNRSNDKSVFDAVSLMLAVAMHARMQFTHDLDQKIYWRLRARLCDKDLKNL